jgi:hypothetical protein
VTVKKPLLNAIVCVALLPVPTQADAPRPPVVVPFELLLTKHMVIKIRVNGKGPYRVIFDTGAPVSLLSNKVAVEAGLVTQAAAKPAFALFGPIAQMRVKSMEVGGMKAEAVPVIVMDHPAVTVISQMIVPVEGILGFPFFARYAMTLDYQTKELTFVPNGFEPVDIFQTLMREMLSRDRKSEVKFLAPAGLWGFTADKKVGDDEAGVTIHEVLADSAAARAGLKAGDRLLILDDRWTDSIADCYSAASYVKPGTEVRVVVQRQGKELEFKVVPDVGL